MEVFFLNKSKSIVKTALKGTVMHFFTLILLSIAISYLTYLISMNIKYAIDGVLFSNYNEIPIYINKIMKHNYIFDLLIISIIIICLNLIEKLLNYFRKRITTKFELKINTNLKSSLYKHVLNLEYESYNSYDKIEMMQRINEDSEVYANFFKEQFNVILDIIFLTVFILDEGITLNRAISTYILLGVIVMLLFSLWYFKNLGIRIENMIIKRKKLLNLTINNISNFKFIRMFNKQKEENDNYKILNDDYCREENIFIKLVLFYEIILEHLAHLSSPIIYIIGGIAIIKGNMTMGSLIAFNTLAEKIFSYIYTFGSNLEIIDNFQIVTKKIKKIFNLKEENKENYQFNLDGRIIFSNVSIYVDDKNILKNINFIIEKGEHVAIIGENGSGKSVLAKTILGFYKYDGNIYINNQNIKRLNKENIRRYVELVLGESYMFSGSIIENLELNKNMEQKELDKITRDSDIKSDIDRFEDGYNTLIGEKGAKLSGGQKQRICIARSLVNNKPIIILDEALNKLDSKTREKILLNLKNKYNEKTIILVSNNLEIIDYVSKIIYINGKTTQTGTHNQLLAKSKNYRNLIKMKENVI